MKKIILLILLSAAVFCGCSNDDKESNEKTVKYIDLSDLTIYLNGEEVLYNNIKKVDLATSYFGSVFQPGLYEKYVIDLYGGKLTYTFLDSLNNERKIVSTYSFRNDSLFIQQYDSTTGLQDMFVALGSSPDLLYRRRSMVRYPLSTGKDTVHITSEIMDLEKVLELADIDYSDFQNMSDTIAWCNMVYIYK